MHLDARCDLNALQAKELLLLVLDQVRQLVQRVHSLKHASADGIADPQVRDAPVGVDLVEVFEQRRAWPLRVLELELLLQAE